IGMAAFVCAGNASINTSYIGASYIGAADIRNENKEGGAAELEKITTLDQYRAYVNKNSPQLKFGQLVFSINGEIFITTLNYFKTNLARLVKRNVSIPGGKANQNLVQYMNTQACRDAGNASDLTCLEM